MAAEFRGHVQLAQLFIRGIPILRIAQSNHRPVQWQRGVGCQGRWPLQQGIYRHSTAMPAAFKRQCWRRADQLASAKHVGAQVGATDQDRQWPRRRVRVVPELLVVQYQRALGFARVDRRRQHTGVVDLHRRTMGIGNDHGGRTETGDFIQLLGEFQRQAHATM
ncbi:hypothetical protein D3C79_836970 [compost metagenome]